MNMSEYITQHEATIRLSCFVAVLLIMAGLELVWPRRTLRIAKVRRWSNNLSLVLINTLVIRVLFPTAAVGVALTAGIKGWGLFNLIPAPHWVAVVVSIVALDLLIYWQHVLMHKIPVLWKLHRVHHVDLDFDVTTGARFHPIEIVVSMLIKFAAIVALGTPVLAVVIFEVVLNATAMFNHSNVRLATWLDSTLRIVLVTPDMHRVHHSTVRKVYEQVQGDDRDDYSHPVWCGDQVKQAPPFDPRCEGDPHRSGWKKNANHQRVDENQAQVVGPATNFCNSKRSPGPHQFQPGHDQEHGNKTTKTDRGFVLSDVFRHIHGAVTDRAHQGGHSR